MVLSPLSRLVLILSILALLGFSLLAPLMGSVHFLSPVSPSSSLRADTPVWLCDTQTMECDCWTNGGVPSCL